MIIALCVESRRSISGPGCHVLTIPWRDLAESRVMALSRGYRALAIPMWSITPKRASRAI